MIGDRIKEYRIHSGFTQAELAQKVDVKPSVVSSWEIGRTEPNLGQCSKMSKLFDVSIDELVTGKKDSDVDFGSMLVVEKDREPNYDHLIAYLQLPLEKRKMVDAYISFIAGQ